MSRRAVTKSGTIVVGQAPELKLEPYLIPKELRKVFENDIQAFADMSPKSEAYLSALEAVINKNEIEAESYVNQLKLLMYMEEYECEVDMRMYDLYDQKIQRSGSGRDFMIYVPGLGDERPSLRLYDEVQLRQKDGSSICQSAIIFVGQKYVKITASEKFAKKYSEDQLYNIKFLLPRRTIQVCQHAISLIEKNQLVSALFPQIKTCHKKLSKELTWFDNNIANNVEQRQAICNIVAKSAHPAPYLLFGPPGTGKTATLVEAISQIWISSPSSHILICTPSNAAADEIVKRLLNNIPQQDIHRMYGPSRSWDDIDEEIQPCSNFVDGQIIFLPKDLIMLRRIVVATLVSSARLLALKLRENHFSYVFIDEAGQATEPETLIPVGLMSSSDPSHKGRLHGQLVLSGDPMQLGPSVSGKRVNTLAKSMLERLMEQCTPYRKDDTGKYNTSYITKLIRNFRSNKFILHIPNKLFYEGELLECGKDVDINRARNYPILPNKSFPLIFHAVLGEERRESNSPSMYNADELVVIMQYLQRLIGSKLGNRKLKQKDIGIVTPYKLQRIKIHQELEKRNWTDVSVGTVEIFQGQERDVIIITTVRSSICKHNGKEHLGFLSNPKRFNVAVTRAKSLLITIGHPNILQFDDCWKKLMYYCKENQAYIGTPVSQLSNRQKQNLIAKRYNPKKVSKNSFQFPVAQEPVIPDFKNCKLLDKIEPRIARMPKINQDLAPIPQCEFDFGITSTSNSSSPTDSDNMSQDKNHESPSISDESDEPLVEQATVELLNDNTSTGTSFSPKNLLDYLGEMNNDYRDVSDNSEISTNSSDYNDAQDLLLELDQLSILSYI